MNDWKDQFQNEIEDLKQLRDEIRLKAHLAKADIKDSIDDLEGRWPEVDQKIKEFESQASDAINETAQTLVTELKSAYQKLKAELK